MDLACFKNSDMVFGRWTGRLLEKHILAWRKLGSIAVKAFKGKTGKTGLF